MLSSSVDRIVAEEEEEEEEVEVTERLDREAAARKTVQTARGNRETRRVLRLPRDRTMDQRRTRRELRVGWKTAPRVPTRETADVEEDGITDRKTIPGTPESPKIIPAGLRAARTTMLVDLVLVAENVVVVDRDNAGEADSEEDVANSVPQHLPLTKLTCRFIYTSRTILRVFSLNVF